MRASFNEHRGLGFRILELGFIARVVILPL